MSLSKSSNFSQKASMADEDRKNELLLNKVSHARFTETAERGFDIVSNLQFNSTAQGSKTIYQPFSKPKRSLWSKAMMLSNKQNGFAPGLSKAQSTPSLNRAASTPVPEQVEALKPAAGPEVEAQEMRPSEENPPQNSEAQRETLFALA